MLVLKKKPRFFVTDCLYLPDVHLFLFHEKQISENNFCPIVIVHASHHAAKEPFWGQKRHRVIYDWHDDFSLVRGKKRLQINDFQFVFSCVWQKVIASSSTDVLKDGKKKKKV